MDEKEKAMLFASVGKLENSLKKLAESAKEKSTDIRSFAKVLRETENLPTQTQKRCGLCLSGN